MRKIIIAIDGPAGAGKTSTAKLLATKLKYIYIDTGAMYRAVTLAYLNSKTELNNENLAKTISNISIELKPSDNGQITLLNGTDVSEEIRSVLVNQYVSPVSANEHVRKKLVDIQRKLGERKCCVMDGRDIGTIVFPNAELKIFLTASLEERTKRRWLEYNKQAGVNNLSFDEVLEQISSRDKYDSSRAVSPLYMADDAIKIDNSNITLEQQVEIIYNLAIDIIGN